MAKEAKDAKIRSSQVRVKVVSKQPKQRSLFLNIIIILGIAIVLYSLTAATPVPYTTQELMQKGDAYTVLVPYTAEVPYQERVPYGPQNCQVTDYSFTDSYVIDNKIMQTPDGTNKWFMVCTITVKNNEDADGNFTYSAIYKKKNVGFIDAPQQTKDIPAQGSVDFVFAQQMDNFGDFVSCAPRRVTIATGNICKYTEPITYTYVTKYKNITDYKNETRYKDKSVEKMAYKYVNKAFGYEQFFYLGY